MTFSFVLAGVVYRVHTDVSDTESARVVVQESQPEKQEES